MPLKHLYNLLRGKIDPAKLTWRNVYAVLQAWWRGKKRNISGFELPDHMWEQIVWRRSEVQQLSPKCWRDGVCKICGCEVLPKTMEDRECEGKCYPPMMGKGEWERYKLNNHIKLFV